MKKISWFLPKVLWLLIFIWVSSLRPANAQPSDDERMEWWRDAKFGLFIHWGLYAVPAGEYNGQTNYGEWIMEEAHIPVKEYEKFAAQFNPVQFNADEWVRMAKQAGMKYIVITSKHHDGFSLWDSKVSDYDVADRTPFKRDIMKELSDACKKQGVVFAMYHSIMDWHHPDAKKPNFDKYREEYLKPQLEELVKKYDPAVLWFDGEWIDEWTEPQGRELYNWLRAMKPNLIINNRVGKGRNGMQGMTKDNAVGDFGTPEQEILEEKSSSDWESCMTMNNHWGFNKNDNNWKSTNQLLWNLVDVVTKGGNYLLNVGPTGQGLFPQASVERLAQMGTWIEKHQEAIYGVKAWDYFHDGEHVRYAADKQGDIFVYVQGAVSKALTLRKILPMAGSSISVVGHSAKLPWKQTADGVTINLPDELLSVGKSNMGNIIVLKMKGTPAKLSVKPVIGTPEEAAAKTKVIAGNGGEVAIEVDDKDAVIRYTTDGTEPNNRSAKYSMPMAVNNSGMIKAVAYAPGKMPSDVAQLQIVKGKYAISLNSPTAPQYTGYGPVTLVDGLKADAKNFHKGWLGFEGKNMEAIIDLGESRAFQKVSGSFLRNHGSWIFLPVSVTVYTSDDGKTFKESASKQLSSASLGETTERITVVVDKPGKARFLKVKAESVGICPPWHAGNGGKAWLFADEISVE